MKKYVKTQGKNSKLKGKTQKVGTFIIHGCRKSVQKSLFYKVCNDVIFKNIFFSFVILFICVIIFKNSMLCGMCSMLNSLAVVERENSSAAKVFFVCVFTLSTTARTVKRSSFSFIGEETLYYRG